MSNIHKNEKEWINFNHNGVTVVRKVGEKNRLKYRKNKEYKSIIDIIEVICPKCNSNREILASSLFNDNITLCRSCSFRKECIGRQSGDLTVTSFYKVDKINANGKNCSYTVYKCDCKCGNTHDVRASVFIVGESQCCKICQKGARLRISLSNREPIKRYIKSIKNAAKQKKLIMNVSKEFLVELIKRQNHKCTISGIKISLNDGTASLDRIDSSIGYIESNVQWVHRYINYMKTNLKQEEFIDFCKAVTKYQESLS